MVTLTVTDIHGKSHTFEVQEDENKSILEIAADHGVELPYSCMSGACFSCCAEVKQGKEHLDNEKIGEQLIDVEDDEVLCCIGGVDAQAFAGDAKNIEIQMMN